MSDKLTRRRTAERYDVTSRTVVRWENDPKVDFPAPEFINGRAYHDCEKLDEADARRARQSLGARAVGAGKAKPESAEPAKPAAAA